MGVTLTEKAASEVKKIITEQNLPEGTVLRVGVQGGGCSGFSYSLGFDTDTSEKDRVTRRPWRQAGGREEIRPLSRRDGRRLLRRARESAGLCSTTRTWSESAAAGARSRSELVRNENLRYTPVAAARALRCATRDVCRSEN